VQYVTGSYIFSQPSVATDDPILANSSTLPNPKANPNPNP